MFGLDLEDGLAAAVGGYLVKNLGSLAQQFLPGIVGQVDNLRPGLGLAASELAGVALLDWAAGRFARGYRRAAALGGTAVAISDGISAVAGQVHLLSGQPAFPFGRRAAPLPAPSSNAGALPASSGSSIVPSSVSLLGYGSYGY